MVEPLSKDRKAEGSVLLGKGGSSRAPWEISGRRNRTAVSTRREGVESERGT